jgi:hypothetical protein
MRRKFDNTPAPPVNVCRDGEGQYILQRGDSRNVERFASVQSVWEALDELDAPRPYSRAA